MDTKPKIKQIQLLGSTFVSGYFAFAELVNYKQFNQRKVIKRFERGGIVQYGTFGDKCLNVVKQDDSSGSVFIRYNLGGDIVKQGYFYPTRPTVLLVPFDYEGDIFIVKGNAKFYDSTNKSYGNYIFADSGSAIWVNSDLVSHAVVNPLNSDTFAVAFIDMCINTTEPITLNYVGEAEFIQNSNIDNNFTPLFKINRYDYNCY